MLEVRTVQRHRLPRAGKTRDGFPSAMAALLAARYATLRLLERLLCRAEVARIFNRFTLCRDEKTSRPRSMPVSLPVGGMGWSGTSAHENTAYQPTASCETVTVLGVPSIGRLHRTASRPILESTRKPFASCAPLPNCF
jgi:hypothetical protein